MIQSTRFATVHIMLDVTEADITKLYTPCLKVNNIEPDC